MFGERPVWICMTTWTSTRNVWWMRLLLGAVRVHIAWCFRGWRGRFREYGAQGTVQSWVHLACVYTVCCLQVSELQDDLLVGLAVPFEGCDAGTSHVLRCTKILQDVLDL